MRTPAILIAVALVISACTSRAEGAEPEPEPSRPVAQTSTIQSLVGDAVVGASVLTFDTVPDGASYIVRPMAATLDIYDAPDGVIGRTSDERNPAGGPLTLAVIGNPGEDWTHVRLATRPNFSTGWVRTAEVAVTWTTLRIAIDLSDKTLTLLDGDEVVTWGTVAIGTPGTPTPIGDTFVSELLATPEVAGLYGPFAFGLAVFSNNVTEYAGGDGQIGIHGTNQPELLGTGASLGCVRTHNDLIRDLAGRVPLGTPAKITA